MDCSERGFKLLSIDSQMEEDFVKSVVKDLPSEKWHTGGHRAAGLPYWTWVPSTESWAPEASGPNDSRYRNWRPVQPNDATTLESCLYIKYYNDSDALQWFDYRCSTKRSYICEQPRKVVCGFKHNTLIVEGSIEVKCADDCQAKCQADACCEVRK